MPSRVAEFLLELAEDFGRRESRGWFIDLIMSQEELATLQGMLNKPYSIGELQALLARIEPVSLQTAQ